MSCFVPVTGWRVAVVGGIGLVFVEYGDEVADVVAAGEQLGERAPPENLPTLKAT